MSSGDFWRNKGRHLPPYANKKTLSTPQKPTESRPVFEITQGMVNRMLALAVQPEKTNPLPKTLHPSLRAGSREKAVYFQSLATKADIKTGNIKVRGRGENGESVGLMIKGFKHHFFLSKQIPFETEEEVAKILCIIESGLRTVASGSDTQCSKSFKSPDPRYKSKNAFPQTVFLDDRTLGPDDNLYHSWSLIKDTKKTCYHKTPDTFTENVVMIFVEKPCYAKIIHKYLESDHFRRFYLTFSKISYDQFTKGHMMRTFEATNDIDLSFRERNDLCMGYWWVVHSYETDFEEHERTIECDRYLECYCTDVVCDYKKEENANLLRMGWDIETAGKIMPSGKARFPIACWNQYRYNHYAQNMLKLPPPSSKFCCKLKGNNIQKSVDNEIEEMEALLGEMLDNVDEDIPEEGTLNQDVVDVEKKSREDCKQFTKDWTPSEWSQWLSWAIDKTYSPDIQKEMAQIMGVSHPKDLVPDPKDTDPVIVICAATRKHNEDVDLKFYDAVAFVYLKPGTSLDDLKEDDRGANIWKFNEIKINTFTCEAEMILSFFQYRRKVGPDIEETWNGRVFFDLPYLWDRLHHLQVYGTEKDKRQDFNFNFGFERGKNLKSMYYERFTTSAAGGDKLERIITTDLLIHNDGYLIITNQSFGEKNSCNKLDYISMKKLVYSRENTEKAIGKLVSDGRIDEKTIHHLLDKKLWDKPIELEESKKLSITKKANIVFNDFPMRKMQMNVEEGTMRWQQGGKALKDFVDYCFVDSVLPVLIGGNLSLQIAISRAANVAPSDVFYRGVQMKVFALISSVCKKDFGGKLLIPDKGALDLHFPCIFDDFEVGFEQAALNNERLTSLRPVLNFIQKQVSEPTKNPCDVETPPIEEVMIHPTPTSPLAKFTRLNQTPRVIPNVKRVSSEDIVSSSRGASARRSKQNRVIHTKNSQKVPPGAIKKAARKKKAVAKKKKYPGARVLNPLVRGLIKTKVPTLDFSSLYPSMIFAWGLCFTTMLTSQSIKKYGFEKWQYNQHVMGMASETLCGELVVDAELAKKHGYHSDRLKVSYFYSEKPEKTIYGVLVKKLGVLRGIAKRLMFACEKAVELLDIIIDGVTKEAEKDILADLKPLNNGKYWKMIVEDQSPLNVVKLEADRDFDGFNNKQTSYKILNNSGYGFPSVSPSKATLPMMEIGATTTAIGREQIGLAKAIAQRITGRTMSRYAALKKKLSTMKNPYDEMKPYETDKITPDLLSRRCDFDKGVIKTVIGKNSKENPLKRRKMIDCSELLKLPEGWIYDRRHILSSETKSDVIYGDTDSIMVSFVEWLFRGTGLQSALKVSDGSNLIASHINFAMFYGMCIIFEKMAEGMLLLDKKLYMMRLIKIIKGKLKVELLQKGSFIKRDTIPFVKNIIGENIENLLEAIGLNGSIEDIKNGIVDSVKDHMRDLLNEKVDLRDLTLYKRLTKLVYKAKLEHVAVADKMKKRGEQIALGDPINYTFVQVPYHPKEMERFRTYQKNKAKFNREVAVQRLQNKGVKRKREDESEANVRPPKMPKIPKRKTYKTGTGKGEDFKGGDVAEDISRVEELGLTLDIQFIYEHRILKPLLSYFCHILFPRDDTPHVDEDRMNPNEIIEVTKIQKKIKQEQKQLTRELLFGDFERDLKKKLEALATNACLNHETSQGKPSAWNTQRYHECAYCHKIEKRVLDIEVEDTSTLDEIKRQTREAIYNGTKLPEYICNECSQNVNVILTDVLKRRKEAETTKSVLDKVCTGCAYLLDSPSLDTDQCKSSHCSIFQQKKEAVHKIKLCSNQQAVFERHGCKVSDDVS